MSPKICDYATQHAEAESEKKVRNQRNYIFKQIKIFLNFLEMCFSDYLLFIQILPQHAVLHSPKFWDKLQISYHINPCLQFLTPELMFIWLRCSCMFQKWEENFLRRNIYADMTRVKNTLNFKKSYLRVALGSFLAKMPILLSSVFDVFLFLPVLLPMSNDPVSLCLVSSKTLYNTNL